jgi:hypothetical protein
MKAARLRLSLAAGLFMVWIGWLAYLAVTAGTSPVDRKLPVVLSRPQFLVSTLDVIAQVNEEDSRPAARVRIVQVHWPPSAREKAKDDITVIDLARCSGWEGPGEYILPLEESGADYQVTPIPRSPGYTASGLSPPRIYRSTPETMRQLEAIHKPDTSG